MRYSSLRLILCLSFFKASQSAIAVRKFVHQKDISEYCRRRVVPSVFLGKHVVDANSQILHFSRLQLPYSCSISVRTEFGNNIILVIQLVSDQSLISSCGPGLNQLQIYELGETFGGYWGALPNAMMRTESHNYTNFYTLKTTPTVTMSTPDIEDDDGEEIDTKKDALSFTRTTELRTQEEFMRVDVPLLNVSGDFGFDEVSSHRELDMDEMVDLIYDVTPRNGGIYDTSILPLVQFSIKKEKGERRNGFLLEPKYEFDYNLAEYTPDSRISYSTLFKKKSTRRYKTTKRLQFRRKHLGDIRAKPAFAHNKIFSYERTSDPYITSSKSSKNLLLPTINQNVLSVMYNEASVNNRTPWNLIEHLLAAYNLTTTEDNLSYLHQKEYITSSTVHFINESTKHEASDKTAENSRSTVPYSKDRVGTINTPKNVISDLNDDEVKVFFTVSDSAERETGSLVNHKSFENVVQAAPVIAVLLNRTNTLKRSEDTAISRPSSALRKKRYIKSLDIEGARPRIVTKRSYIKRTTEKVYRYSDMQDLAQLVELQDDEIEGRVALRYLRKYVGSALFNICDYSESKTRQVYLFNSSRIVIAISNFTMERMTLVVTPARTLLSSVSQCPPANLECQVAGTRVCIDSTNECDGVPNCGAYDIYDEDRLRCGWSIGLQHNVCLAACTLIAVILTLLYTIYYWLKRCVPRVSEAFFVYTDSSENLLYLDTVMRSPNDNSDNYSKLFYQANIFDDEDEFLKNNKKLSLFRRIITRLSALLQCKKKKMETYSDEAFRQGNKQSASIPRKLYSFTELELRNITPIIKDATVQTGDSLEGSLIDNKKENYQKQSRNENVISNNSRTNVNYKQSIESSELNLLKLIRTLKISPNSNDSSNRIEEDDSNKITDVGAEEEELRNTLYERNNSPITEAEPIITSDININKSKREKHLRFDDVVVVIRRNEDDDNESIQSDIVVGSSRQLNTIREAQETPSTSGNEFMRFWRSVKNKKSQKKSHLSPR